MSTPAPITRSLAAVLRRQQGDAQGTVRLGVGTVVAVVPGGTYLDVNLTGTTVRVPRLAGYAAVVGDVVYLLASDSILLAIGTVK